MIGLILCGGKGERMKGVLPIGFPKVNVQVGGVPIIDYVEASARALGCDPIVRGDDPDVGTVAVVEKHRRREFFDGSRAAQPSDALVFNGDTLLFGSLKLPEELFDYDRLVPILGRSVESHHLATALYFVPKAARLPKERFNLEDIAVPSSYDAGETLSFIDCGTPRGLREARNRIEAP